MDSVLVKVDERLEHAGDSFSLAQHIEQDSYSLGEHDLELPEGIDFDVVVTNVGEGILVNGILRAHVLGECDRCLEEARFDVASEVDGYYLFEPPAEDEEADDEEEEVDYFLVGEDNTIDLADALNTALIMDTPFVVLCKDDCKGLCPKCGANLNEGDCGCAATAEEEKLAESPFAVLRDLKLDGAADDDTDGETK